jgi:hypothetical protein
MPLVLHEVANHLIGRAIPVAGMRATAFIGSQSRGMLLTYTSLFLLIFFKTHPTSAFAIQGASCVLLQWHLVGWAKTLPRFWRARIMRRLQGENMHFKLTDEQIMIQTAAREFAQSEIVPIAAQFDASGVFPEASIRHAGELGFMGVEVPEEYGGAGLDSLSFALVIEEISAADAAHGVIVSVNNTLYGVPLLEFGSEEQKA